MEIKDALLVEGTLRFAVLCYGVFPISHLDIAREGMRTPEERGECKTYSLLNDDWESGILLRESSVFKEEDIPYVICKSLRRMFEVGPCHVAVCMFDGAFSAYDDILSETIAAQTYAYCLSGKAPVIVMDSNVLISLEWRALVAHARERCSGL